MSNGYLGSPSILISTSNEEILPSAPESWTDDRYTLYALSFLNKTLCTVIINNGNPIHLEANQGFKSTKDDAPIESFVIVTPNIQYSWIGAY